MSSFKIPPQEPKLSNYLSQFESIRGALRSPAIAEFDRIQRQAATISNILNHSMLPISNELKLFDSAINRFRQDKLVIDRVVGTAFPSTKVKNIFTEHLGELNKATSAVKGAFGTDALFATGQLRAFDDALANFRQQTLGISGILNSAFLPTANQIKFISSALGNVIEPFGSNPSWAAALASRMATLQTAWVLPDNLGQSMLGFARLSRLSDVLHVEEPFATPVSKLVAEELGLGVESNLDDEAIVRDAAAVEGGLNPELIAFPPAAYNRVLFAVGFEFQFTSVQVPQTLEENGPSIEFDPMHGYVLTQVEQGLRQVVEKHLRDLNGQKWEKQRISEKMRARWSERQAEARAAGSPVFNLIQYADFLDLADIIGQGDNWSDAFHEIFGNREDLIVSLRRLHPVRKAIAHSRPLSRAEVLTLVSEATRVLRALGSQVLH